MAEIHIAHHGIKGMKWGVRRYQNKDGSLTPAGKKRISKEYKKLSDKAGGRAQSGYTKRYVDAYNKAADYMNNGGIDRYNASQRKKYGENYMDRDDYISDYKKKFEKLLAKNFNKSLYEFYQNDPSYQKAKQLVDKYGMTEWDEFARNFQTEMDEIRRMIEE